MTAQAGAVAAWIDPCDLDDMDAHGTCVDLYPNQIGDAYVPLYRNPPAAVPVEALEGLVSGWLTDAEYLEADGERVRANDLRRRADELTQLIKERSNG